MIQLVNRIILPSLFIILLASCAVTTTALVTVKKQEDSCGESDSEARTKPDDTIQKSIPPGEAKIVVFRLENYYVSLLFSINDYAFASVGGGASFSINVPAGKEMRIGYAIIQADTGNCIGDSYKTFSLYANDQQVYYYVFSLRPGKIVMDKISETEAMKYLKKTGPPKTSAYNNKIDWDFFFDAALLYNSDRIFVDINKCFWVKHYRAIKNHW